MLYILAVAIFGIAVVLAIFTGIWGGLVWIVAAGLVLAAGFVLRARAARVPSADPHPTGVPRSRRAAPGTANERVGQS